MSDCTPLKINCDYLMYEKAITNVKTGFGLKCLNNA